MSSKACSSSSLQLQRPGRDIVFPPAAEASTASSWPCSSASAAALCSTSLGEEEMQEVTRDVAARIVQLHWRTWRRQQQQQQQQQAQLAADPPSQKEAAEDSAMAARQAAFVLLGLENYEEEAHAVVGKQQQQQQQLETAIDETGPTLASPDGMLQQPERAASPALHNGHSRAMQRGRLMADAARLCRSEGQALRLLPSLKPISTATASGTLLPPVVGVCSSTCFPASAVSSHTRPASAVRSGVTASSGSLMDSVDSPSPKLLAELTSSVAAQPDPTQQPPPVSKSQDSLDLQPAVAESTISAAPCDGGTHGQRDQAPRDCLVPHPPAPQMYEHQKQQSAKPPGLARLRRSLDERRSWSGPLIPPQPQCTDTAAAAAGAAVAADGEQVTSIDDCNSCTDERPQLPPAAEPAVAPPADSAADKLLSLLGYLDAVDQEAEGEAATASAALGGVRRSISLAVHGGSDKTGTIGHAMLLEHQHQSQALVPPAVTTSNRSAALAKSVFDGVRARLGLMEEELAARDALLAQAHADAEALAAEHLAELEAERGKRAAAVAATRAECEEAAARQLAFIDRLMADKDELGERLAAAGAAIEADEGRHAAAISALKEGWAAELRRQREAWGAAERVKREAWAEAKAAEIKALTVKGLEVEVQRLIARHRSELGAAQLKAAADAARQADAQRAQHEQDLRHLRERLAKVCRTVWLFGACLSACSCFHGPVQHHHHSSTLTHLVPPYPNTSGSR